MTVGRTPKKPTKETGTPAPMPAPNKRGMLATVIATTALSVLCLGWTALNSFGENRSQHSPTPLAQAQTTNHLPATGKPPVNKAHIQPKTSPKSSSPKKKTRNKQLSPDQERMSQILSGATGSQHGEHWNTTSDATDGPTNEQQQPAVSDSWNEDDDAQGNTEFETQNSAPSEPADHSDARQDNFDDDFEEDLNVDGDQPEGGLVGGLRNGNAGAAPTTNTIIREVPVFIPVAQNNSGRGRQGNGGSSGNANGSGNNAGQGGAGSGRTQPAVNVLINLVDRTSPIMTVDFQSNPGLTAQLSVNLDTTPTTPVTVTLTLPNGLSCNQTTITFPANVSPTAQIVTVSGNGQMRMTGPTRIVNIGASATGGGLRAGQPVQIPVQVLRRNRWNGSNGLIVARNDTINTTASNQNWTTNFGPTFTANSANYYTRNYVEVLNPAGLKVRVYNNRIDVETAVGSGAFFSNVVNGAWQ